jgi:RNA polymerase sigma factor FliA
MDINTKNNLFKEAQRTLDIVVATVMKKFSYGLDKDEIYGFALFGLAEAIEKYDPDIGNSIGAYAAPRIRGAIYDGLSESSNLPRSMIRKILFLKKHNDMDMYENIDDDAADKIEATHKIAEKLKEMATAYVVSVAKPELFPDDDKKANAETLLHQKESNKQLHEAIDSLGEINKKIIICFFFKDMNISETSKHLGFSASAISRKLKVALHLIRTEFDKKNTDYYNPT